MGGTLPGVTTLMAAFDKTLSAFNLSNSRGNWFYQTERNKMPMDDVSPEEAAMFFHTVEVNLNQTTTVVGWVPNAARVHAIESKPKAKPKAKSASSPERVKSSSAPSTPLRTEGPAPPNPERLMRLQLLRRIPERERASLILTNQLERDELGGEEEEAAERESRQDLGRNQQDSDGRCAATRLVDGKAA